MRIFTLVIVTRLPFYYKYFFRVFPQVLEKRVVARKQKKNDVIISFARCEENCLDAIFFHARQKKRRVYTTRFTMNLPPTR